MNHLSKFSMSGIILHHYPQSPVTEKVRVILGIKSLHWHSVEIPRLPPKPDLMPLTGGYRRTPVMQIGADIYCDSQCIIGELERRYPEPSIFPGDSKGLAWGVSRWTDGPIFTSAIAVVLGTADKLPADFAADRGRLYFGADFDLATIQSRVNESLAQIRGQLQWFEQHLETGKEFLSGPEPGLVDALCYYLIWFIRGRWAGGPEFLNQFGNLIEWEQRIFSIGHGHSVKMNSTTALDIAKAANPLTPQNPDPEDPCELKPGMTVSIVPEGDGGDPPVIGELINLSCESVAITRHDQHVGNIVVHFPRVGYRVVSC
jgi:glutathione S-transferase